MRFIRIDDIQGWRSLLILYNKNRLKICMSQKNFVLTFEKNLSFSSL